MTIRRASLIAVAALMLSAHAALATHTSSGLTSTLLGRGTWDRADLSELANELGDLHRMGGSDVAVVRATLAPGGTTDWHGHPGPSTIVVTAGTIRVLEATRSGGCEVSDYTTGQAFFHSQHAHSFVNPGTSVAEFYVVYFSPAGPLLVHEPDPSTC
jgi:quercetin dioxygenase-like cupin family protein